MAQDYTEYLAINVLNEQQIVSYRLLSRALKVHVNLAKQMLYEFHRKQNAKKPGSVHATYLLTGTRRPHPSPSQTNGKHSQEDGAEDTVMRSSPPLPSSSFPQPDSQTEAEPAPLIRSIMLVKQEHLEQAQAAFETISSIHIYSLEAHALSDVQVLTECNRKVAADYASEDPLDAWKQYGTIQNPNVKRRKRGTAPPPPPAPVAKTAETKAKPAPPTATKSEQKPDSKASSTKPTPEPEQQKVGAKKPAPTKRQSSDIFKSFAKPKTKPAGESHDSASASPPLEDSTMTGFSEDEADDADLVEAEQASEVQTGKSKKERAAELAAMMDQEDEQMEEAPAVDAGLEELEPENAIDKVETPEEEEPKESVKVENGRRRGRRRVMKKITAKDEEGYLVTKEEAAWESFSEDEPPPKKARLSSTNASSKPVAKKGGKPGQGNIMSFFGKK